MKSRTLAFILIADLGLILLLEILLHLFGLFAPQPIFTEFKDPSGQTQVRFELATTKPVFPAAKPSSARRIFCYGDSTAFGFPFHLKTSFAAQLELLLNRASPGRRWEVINLAMVSLDSEEVRDVFRASQAFSPDLAIIYCGQNEYFRSSLLNELEHPRLIAARNFLGRHSRIYRAILRLGPLAAGVPVFGMQAQPEWLERLDLARDLEPLEQKPIAPQVLRLRQDLFQYHLLEMLEAAQAAKLPVILSTLVVNLRDWPPEPRPFPEGLAPDQIQSLSELIFQAEKELAVKDPVSAERTLLQAQAVSQNYPIKDFLLGRALEAQGKRGFARELFLRARANDVNKHRAPAEMNAIIRQAAKAKGAKLLDTEQLFAQATVFAAPGFDLLLDHVHPNLAGQSLISAALLHAIQEMPLPFPTPAWQPAAALSEAEIVRAFNLDSIYLAEVYLRLGLYYGLQKNLPDRNAWTLATFDRVRALSPANPLPRLCQALIHLSQAEPELGLAQLSRLKDEMPAEMTKAIHRYLSRSVSLRENALLVSLPPDPLRPPLQGLLLTRPPAAEPREQAWKPLPKYNRCFEWRPSQKQFLEVTDQVQAALRSRRKKLAGLNHPLHAFCLICRGRPTFLQPGPGMSPRSRAEGKSYWLEGTDAQLISENLKMDAELVESLVIEYQIKLEKPEPPIRADLYWAAAEADGFSEDRKIQFEVLADGKFHRDQIPLGQMPGWVIAGTVTRIRLDPAPASGELSLIELSLQPFTSVPSP